MMYDSFVVPPNAQKKLFLDCFFAFRVQGPPPLLESSMRTSFIVVLDQLLITGYNTIQKIALQMVLEQGETYRHSQFILKKR